MKPFTVIIPARFGSSRLPGKPLALIHGKTMIERVVEQASKSEAKKVIVATDDERVFEHLIGRGHDVVMTSPEHESGTDRLQEVAQKLSLADDEIVINVQGDEPLIPPSVINQVAKNLFEHPLASAATLSEPIESIDDVFNPNIVKVVSDIRSMAMYFSRASVPWSRDHYSAHASVCKTQNTASLTNSEKIEFPIAAIAQRHIGIYAYRVKLLNQFVGWPLAPVENIEKLEQLRILYNGFGIHVDQAIESVPGGVDTQEDLDKLIGLLNQK